MVASEVVGYVLNLSDDNKVNRGAGFHYSPDGNTVGQVSNLPDDHKLRVKY